MRLYCLYYQNTHLFLTIFLVLQVIDSYVKLSCESSPKLSALPFSVHFQTSLAHALKEKDWNVLARSGSYSSRVSLRSKLRVSEYFISCHSFRNSSADSRAWRTTTCFFSRLTTGACIGPFAWLTYVLVLSLITAPKRTKTMSSSGWVQRMCLEYNKSCLSFGRIWPLFWIDTHIPLLFFYIECVWVSKSSPALWGQRSISLGYSVRWGKQRTSPIQPWSCTIYAFL